MSSKRSQWTEFDKDERKYIKKRDKEQCYLCGAKGALQIMHIFVNRAHGGKGERRNGVLGCVRCHAILDNPIGAAQINEANDMLRRCKAYLIDVEHIDITERELCEQLKFSKERDLPPVAIAVTPKPVEHWQPKCGDCKYCVRNRRSNSSIPSYFCKKHYCPAKRSAVACKEWEKYDSRGKNQNTYK